MAPIFKKRLQPQQEIFICLIEEVISYKDSKNVKLQQALIRGHLATI